MYEDFIVEIVAFLSGFLVGSASTAFLFVELILYGRGKK